MNLPDDVNFIINTLQEAGFDAYAVGGCVRDTILKKEPSDWDITTSAKPDAVKELFSHTIDTGIQHGTVTVLLHQVGYEVTTYRIDGDYEDGRHPKEVTFTGELLEDLKRRDFTINAMAYNDRTGLVDAFDGVRDLENGIIRCVGEAEKRFEEDALRMMRAVRFASQLDFQIEEKTYEAIRRLSPSLERVSMERIQVELVKLLTSDHPERMRDLYETGLTAIFLPEWDKCMGCEQNTPHHIYSVGEHTIRVMEGVRADRLLRLSALFHDIAKPEAHFMDADGRDHFTGHPEMGAKLAREILKRLKFDNDTISYVTTMVRFHDERPEGNERAVRRCMNRVGLAAFPELFELKRADTMAQSLYRREEKLAMIDDFERLYTEILQKKQAISVKDLEITGADLLAMGFPQGPDIGRTLKELLEDVLDDPSLNDRETLLEIAEKMR